MASHSLSQLSSAESIFGIHSSSCVVSLPSFFFFFHLCQLTCGSPIASWDHAPYVFALSSTLHSLYRLLTRSPCSLPRMNLMKGLHLSFPVAVETVVEFFYSLISNICLFFLRLCLYAYLKRWWWNKICWYLHRGIISGGCSVSACSRMLLRARVCWLIRSSYCSRQRQWRQWWRIQLSAIAGHEYVD